jgi:2-C-methyl-D-erythritol 4-phosphate cytidylyltransferase
VAWQHLFVLAVKVLQRTIKANKAMAAAAASSTGHKDDEQQLEEDETSPPA